MSQPGGWVFFDVINAQTKSALDLADREYGGVDPEEDYERADDDDDSDDDDEQAIDEVFLEFLVNAEK